MNFILLTDIASLRQSSTPDGKPHLWFMDGEWRCGLSRDAGLWWTGATPTEAMRARYDWLHAKDWERP